MMIPPRAISCFACAASAARWLAWALWRMFDISIDETLALAAPLGLAEIFRRDGTRDELNRSDISWSRLVMRRS